MAYLLEGTAVDIRGAVHPVKLPCFVRPTFACLRWELQHVYRAIGFSFTPSSTVAKLYNDHSKRLEALLTSLGLHEHGQYGRPFRALRARDEDEALVDASDVYWASSVGFLSLLMHYSVERRLLEHKRICDAIGQLVVSKTIRASSYDALPLQERYRPTFHGLCGAHPNAAGRCACMVAAVEKLDNIDACTPQVRMWKSCNILFQFRDCPACMKWLGKTIDSMSQCIDESPGDWGTYDPLMRSDLSVLGPAGKRRRYSKAFKDAAGVQAFQKHRGASTYSILRAVAPGAQGNATRIACEVLWEHQAATEHVARSLHVVWECSDGVRIGKPAREYMPIYLQFAREKLVSCLPPAVPRSDRINLLYLYICTKSCIKLIPGFRCS